MIGAIIGAAVGGIIAGLAKLFTSDTIREVAKFLAYKALLLFLLFVGLAIALKSFVLNFSTEIMQTFAGHVTGNEITPTSLSLTGGIGYAAALLKVPECVSVLISGYAVGMIRSFIPFL